MWSLADFYYSIFIISIGSCNILLKNVKDIENEYKDTDCAVKIMKCVAEEGPKAVTVVGMDNDMGAELLRIDGITIVPVLTDIENNYLKTNLYVVISEDFNDLKKKIINLTNDSYWQPRTYFIISINKIIEKDNLTEFLTSYNIFHVSIILKSVENYDIFSFSAELDNCNRPKNLELTTNCFLFNKSRIFMKFEPKKLNNCSIKFATHDYLPFSGVFPLTNDIGFEEHMLNLIEEKESIKFEVIKFATTHRFGILSNGSYKGMLGMLQKHQIEGVVGGLLLLFEKFITFDSVYPYLLDNIRAVIPLATPLSTWEAVWATLSLATRLLIILFFAIFLFAVSCLAIFRNDRKDLVLDFLIVFGYFLNNIIPRQLKDISSHKLFIISMLLFAFFMNVVIEASVSSVTTKPVNSYQIKDKDGIHDSYFPILLKTFGSNEDSGSVCNSVLECLTKVQNSRFKHLKYRTFVSEIPFDYEKLRLMFDVGNCDLYVGDHSYFLYLHTVYLYRGSTITPILKKYYRHMFHSGILSQFKKTIDHKLSLKIYYNKNFQEKARRLNNHNPGTLNNLKEAFILLLSGYCMSIIVYFFEIVYTKIDLNINKKIKLSSRQRDIDYEHSR